MKHLIAMMALLGVVGSASAFDDWFDHSSTPGDDLWSSAGNWNTGQLPNVSTTNRVMVYPNAGTGGLSQADIAVTIGLGLYLNSPGTTELEILPAGDLTATQIGEGISLWFVLGGNAEQDQTLTVNGGRFEVTTPGAGITIGDAGVGTLTVNSGSFTGNAGVFLTWNNAGSSGTININGGSVTVDSLNIRNFGTVNQANGTNSISNLTMDPDGRYNIMGGTLIVRGQDAIGGLNSYYVGGQITGFDANDPSAFTLTYDGTDTILYVVPAIGTYADWVADWGLTGSDTNRTADLENGGLGDGMDNLLEYALGGNPTNDDAVAFLPTVEFAADSVEYVFRRRVDFAPRNLAYDLMVNPDGLQAPWVNVGTNFVTAIGSIDAEFESVTNMVSTAGIDLNFINLQVTEE